MAISAQNERVAKEDSGFHLYETSWLAILLLPLHWKLPRIIFGKSKAGKAGAL